MKFKTLIAAALLSTGSTAMAKGAHVNEHVCSSYASGAEIVAEHYYEYGYVAGSILLGSGSSIGDQFMSREIESFVDGVMEEFNDDYQEVSPPAVAKLAFAHCMGI